MSRSFAWKLGLLLVLLASAACSNPADDVPAAGVSGATEESTPPSGQVFTIAETSTFGFTGSKVTGSHDGGFNGFQGEIKLVDGDPIQSSIHFVIDTTTLWADNEKLAGHLKSPDFFDAESFPTSVFRSTAIAAADEGYLVTGNLELHGVTKSISFPAQISVEPDRVTATAEFSIKRFDFEIAFPGRADDLIRDEVVIRLDVAAVPIAEDA